MDNPLPPFIKTIKYVTNNPKEESQYIDHYPYFMLKSDKIEGFFPLDIFGKEHFLITTMYKEDFMWHLVDEKYNKYFENICDNGHLITPMRDQLTCELELNPDTGTLIPELADNFDKTVNGDI